MADLGSSRELCDDHALLGSLYEVTVGLDRGAIGSRDLRGYYRSGYIRCCLLRCYETLARRECT